ncbi:Ig-like domain-containing protein [Christensenella intestinihominis]|uniref:Ig-like domain-containing protein n=1 Tax=Christensenella intestinihominis TaxID=1851429 RepID=UPI00082B9344|nr:Ig-like domain-containing protein [Christensenella intestinihominis]
MKKGKKSKMTLGIILILVLMFVGSTVLAAGEDPRMFTWSPNPIIAGGDTLRSVVFNPPEEMVFFNDEYVPVYDTDNTTIIDWKLERTTFTKSLKDLRDMYATDAGADPSFVWEYPNPTYPGQTLNFKNDNKDPDDPFAGKTYFLVPQPTFEMSLKVRYYLPRPSVWNSDDPNPTDPSALGKNPGRSNFAAFNYGGDLPDTGVVTQVSVDKGQPILSGTWPQTNEPLQNMIEMNNLAMPAGATDIPDPNSPYTLKDKTWYRNGFYVYAAKSVAGEGSGSQYEVPVDVTVYVEDGGQRVDLGAEEMMPAVINDINGKAFPAPDQYTKFDLPTVPFDGAALSKLKPGEYTLLADTGANMNNEATHGQEIGTLKVAGISKVSVDPASSSVEKGAAQQFTANVDVVETDQDKVGDKSVVWSVSGQKSRDTKIDPQTGLLTVSADEQAGTITVTAESVFDNNGQDKVRGEAKVTVIEPDHSVTNGTTEIRPGQDGHWEFSGTFSNLRRLSLNGTDFTIIPESATKAQLKYPGYNGVAGIAEEDSVKVTLYKQFLATLPAGEYKLEAFFDDGGVQNIGFAQFTVVKEETQPTATATAAPAATTAPTPTAPTGAPKTGDETNVWLWLVLAAASACALLMVAQKKAVVNKK